MEFLFALGTMFVIFLMLIFVIIDKQSETRISKATLEKLSECQRFANIISALASANEGTNMEFKTDYYIKITPSGSIYANDEDSNVNEVICSYVSNPLDLQLNGNVKLQKIGGNVSAI